MNIQKKIEDFNKINIYSMKSSKGYGFAYFAKKDFKKNDIILKTFGKIIDHQTKHLSMQFSLTNHFLPTKWTGRYLNHSCNSNCFIDNNETIFPILIAKRSIKKDEEINFSYWMSEYRWTTLAAENNIPCSCLEKKCTGKIFSFSDLTKDDKKKNKIFLSKYLKKLI